jgi:hypothetical protein
MSLDNLRKRANSREPRIGVTFLHNHPVSEENINLNHEHVIVDREDWRLVLDYFRKNPNHFNSMLEG